MAKLYYESDFGNIIVRRDDDTDTEKLIEVTPEQASALSLSGIDRALSNLYDVLQEGLPGKSDS